jgi:hypothetical protein
VKKKKITSTWARGGGEGGKFGYTPVVKEEEFENPFRLWQPDDGTCCRDLVNVSSFKLRIGKLRQFFFTRILCIVVPWRLQHMFVNSLINLKIFISTHRMLFKMQYFPSDIFYFKTIMKNLNISENNKINVKTAKVVEYVSKSYLKLMKIHLYFLYIIEFHDVSICSTLVNSRHLSVNVNHLHGFT